MALLVTKVPKEGYSLTCRKAVLMGADGESAASASNAIPVFLGSSGSFASATTSSNKSVGSSTTAIIAANTARKYLAIVNDSDEAVYLGLGVSAVMNKGIRLNPNGGTFEINALNLCTGAINGICTSGSKNVTVTEA